MQLFHRNSSRVFVSACLATASLLTATCNTTGAYTFPSEHPIAFQLQEIDIDELAGSPYRTIVIDPSSDGSDSGRFTAADISWLKVAGKTVLAYLSIGEAESYRGYWQAAWNTSPPSWLGVENPDWEGNYKVRYWHTDWQGIIFNGGGTGSLDYILDAGFDGVYLDIVDAYYYWGSEEAQDAGEAQPYNGGANPSTPSLQTSADEMVDFIAAIAAHARARSGYEQFIVCPQNATDIIHDMSEDKLASWWNTIDAVGAESTYHYGDADMNNPWNPQEDVLSNLDEYRDHDLEVYCIEYLGANRGADIDRFFTAASERGFAYYAADRALDTLRQ
jgi:cysteinyl-tRNA synthetase